MAPAEAKEKVRPLFDGAMKGRTMYVVPYILGPAKSPYSKIGVEITDSAYVVANMRIMSRMGKAALDRLGSSADFVPGLHSLGDLNPERRFIMHFPEEKLIWSVGSGYGGNALLGKKCFALRIASWMARDQGWMAEHMLILGLEDPSGKVTYMAAAFPSACGKTNLAMMVSALESQGYRVWTVGDDIAWMHVASDGTLRAINPGSRIFRRRPRHERKNKSQRNGRGETQHDLHQRRHDAFERTLVGRNRRRAPERPDQLEGRGVVGRFRHRGASELPLHRSRLAVAFAFKALGGSRGLPISALIFGGRRARLAPLVYESRDWQHGVFVGATMASETTAAATGAVGVSRRDPMAMLPFCGYNMGDYFGHWLEMGSKLKKPPKIFHVNWFRKGADGKFLWPGYGENVRVLKWMLDRIEGRAAATETPIGHVPTPSSLTLDGLSISRDTLGELLSVNPSDWLAEDQAVGEFFAKFGSHIPAPIAQEQKALADRLTRSTVTTK